jgi:hypothetical protein
MINGTIIHYINGLYKLIIHDYPFINGILPTQLPVEKRGPVATPAASVFCFFAAGSTASAMVKNDERSAAPVQRMTAAKCSEQSNNGGGFKAWYHW